MKTQPFSTQFSLKKTIFSACLAFFLLMSLVSCGFGSSNGGDQSLQNTQMALSVQQTVMAHQQAELDKNATAAAQQATIVAQGVQATALAQQQPPPVDVAATQAAAAPQPQPPAQTQPVVQPPAGNFNEMMHNASIVVFEDVYSDPEFTPYVQKTFKAMGLNQVKYDAAAQGWLKTDLLSGAPGGKPWDLVIMAIEERDDVSGEYYQYLNDVLNSGSSVILEAWNIDDISEGAISPILIKCGVTVYPYFPETGSNIDAVLWPLGVPHPVLSDPNSGMSFSGALDTWLDSGDLGSLMALTGQGDAVLLLGTNAQEKAQDGALAVCMGGQLILQTFGSHSFPYETMGPLWENYITNALKVRFQRGG
jgi:hypothetical protein